jgi:citrate synthase
VTQLGPDGPAYRGQLATGLVTGSTFEEVAALLWESEVVDTAEWAAPDLGPCPLTDISDRMRWALVMCGAGDPLRADARPESVARAARRVIAALTAVVGPSDGDEGDDPAAPIAQRLARSLVGNGPAAGSAVAAALILMADHELATSTVAVRLAASTRADLYDALLAGLATLAGPLHGGASQHAYDLLVAAERDGAARALNDALRWHRRLHGFGHQIYTERDPRFDALLVQVEPLLTAERRFLLHEVIALASAHDVPPPNCDLALAALAWGTGMPSDAGRTIFTVARVAGWTAHYLEELSERPLRFRARAIYSV